MVPVLLGSGLRNKGIQPLLDAVVWYFRRPVDVPAIVGVDPRDETPSERHSDPQEPLATLAFKVALDQGTTAYLSAPLFWEPGTGSHGVQPEHGSEERVARLLRMYANKRERSRPGQRWGHCRGHRA